MKTTKKPLAKAQNGRITKAEIKTANKIKSLRNKNTSDFKDKFGKVKSIKKMAVGGTTKKMSYGRIKPKTLKKANVGMAMDSFGMNTESDVSLTPPGKKRRGSPYRSGTGGGRGGGRVGACARRRH